MAYATQADMTTRYGADDLMRLTDHSGTLDQIDAAVLQTALDDATAEINGYLAKRHELPLASPPRILTTYCCRIAYYHLTGTQNIEQAKVLYDSAIDFLKQVAKGEVSLGDETAGDSVQSSPGPVFEEGPDRVFDRTSLKNF